MFSRLGLGLGYGLEHNSLSGLEGGSDVHRYHLTPGERTAVGVLVTGVSGVVTLAKLTAGGAQGSLTFNGGVLTAFTQAT